MLALRLTQSQAGQAAAGWGGGQYRAWSNGSSAAVVMDTEWDRASDAEEFAAAVGDWLEGRTTAQITRESSVRVRVLFASDPATLRLLTRVM